MHLPDHPLCVVKQLKPQVTDADSLQVARRLFDTEARVLYQLGNHDQIPRLLAHFEDNQEFYLAQEFIDGESLSDVIVDGQPWSEGRVIALLQDILQVLAFVHQQNVIHRDIKPSNLICRRQDGRIVLIDFGVVKQVSTQLINTKTVLTNLTVSIGTLGYMPNEQMGGNPRFSSDVYAVGMIGIQALTGIQPKHLNQDPKTSEVEWRDRTPPINPALADVLERMVRYNFRARYATAASALDALRQLPSALLDAVPSRWYTPNPSQPAAIPAPTQPSQILSRVTNPTVAAVERVSVQVQHSLRTLTQVLTVAIPGVEQRQSVKILPIVMVLVGVGGLMLLVRACLPSQPTDQLAVRNSAPTASPSSDVDLLNQADSLRETEQYEQALTTYDQAIASNPNSADAYRGRCYTLNQLQRLEEAIAACDQAITLNPNDSQALSSKGYALYQQQRPEAALELFEQAVALQPDNAEAWSNQGATLLTLGQPEAAIESFDQALQLQSDLAEAWNNRGAALWSLGQFDEAIASIDRAIEIQPDYQDALNLRQQIRERLGR
jgi:serine/threonine protein kinase